MYLAFQLDFAFILSMFQKKKKKRNLSPLVVLRSATGGIYLHTPSSPNVGDVWRTTKSIAQLSVIQPVILSISHIFLDDKS